MMTARQIRKAVSAYGFSLFMLYRSISIERCALSWIRWRSKPRKEVANGEV